MNPLRRLAHHVRERYHPLHWLRKQSWFRDAVLPAIDIPVPAPIGMRHPVWIRLMTHAPVVFLAPQLEANIQRAVRLLLASPQFTAGAFYDVGANLGLYTWLVATVRPQMPIISFEPDPRNVALLRRTSRAWRLTNHQIVAAAVSDEDAVRDFVTDAITSATGSLAVDDPQFTEVQFGARGARIPVQTVRLSSLETAPAIIKVDVEGHEEAVFRGAWETIEKHRPAIVFESFEHAAPINARLTQLDYLLFDADRCSASRAETTNHIAIPSEKFDDALRAEFARLGYPTAPSEVVALAPRAEADSLLPR
jgi:FkbM family methyltransferase